MAKAENAVPRADQAKSRGELELNEGRPHRTPNVPAGDHRAGGAKAGGEKPERDDVTQGDEAQKLRERLGIKLQ